MSLNLFKLDRRIALVTGSGQGIGLAIAEGLAAAGAHVVLNGRDAGKLEKARSAIAAAGHKASVAAFDVTDQKAVEAGVAKVEAEIGPIDILVNNAGTQKRGAFVEFPAEDWHFLMATNLHSVFYVTQAVAKRMAPRGRGKIVNIGSVMSKLGRPSIVPYTASKGAVSLMTQGLAAELGKHNIQVNAIGPGYFVTELNQALLADETFSNWVKSRAPVGRWGETRELAGAAIFLSSEASDYVSGHLLMVDGGLTAVV
ncbi:5-keto-D-gluconate-5-reductase [Bosea sp. 62]|uniref:glucose 1-dehydrogenase n=1 Tax=unclassified Bosea (in: a-proteobacteria) TaxID=2653178 RepID=UPI001255E03A|nr:MULTISPECIES: glucose 1-dehydrogenase [unclassified Bosea (in: a-proteobacteria)]CAD5248062.1 5-keto-D-gluconate-5-reductase [Bosea sp. 46]CAD5249462.1 5-keto-D-gluconate-5-reductase [Bosea sp. 21B]CAD5266640.1 5-keto-D-gluconate-5-reductase [Bosea sp. 7B]VVT44988.1 5-keto-D-gluconate-5-reductase [Bosea sp. EC-HK365B]VXB01061.1 5-keto-D-gluconate-5-reductase [Bosea sp. 29B]